MPQSVTRFPNYSITRFVFALLAAAVAVVALARGLPPHAFYVGDPGVKLIAARNAIAHPARPFEIPLPDVAGDPVPWVDPFFIVHDGHSHAVTSELFPLLSAPFIALFGVRGAYVLPASGLLLALAGTAWLALRLDARRSPATVVLTAFLGTPLLFYGLEFWEHALAAGIAALATALFVRAAPATVGPSFSSGATVTYGPAFGSGLLFGVATLLRPEALWFALAVLSCSPLLSPRPPLSAIVLAIGGIAAALVPLELYTLTHFGSVVPLHIAGNPALFSGGWVSMRTAVISSWFLSVGMTSFWRVAPAMLLAPVAMAISAPAALPSRGTGNRLFLLSVALLDIALVVLTAPNDGGGQWGPRYLLLAYLPLAILAADTVSSRPSTILAAMLVGLIALGSAWIQRSAYRQLRGTKSMYGRMADFVAREVPAGGYAVTDLWWLDQIAAAVTADRTILFVPGPDQTLDAIGRLDRARIGSVTIIRSRDESPEPGASNGSTCYQEEGRRDIPDRTLVAIHLRRRCP
jgi:hypothetical protein